MFRCCFTPMTACNLHRPITSGTCIFTSHFSISNSAACRTGGIIRAGTSTKRIFASGNTLLHVTNVRRFSPFSFAYDHALFPLCRRSSPRIAFSSVLYCMFPPVNVLYWKFISLFYFNRSGCFYGYLPWYIFTA